MCSSLSKFFGFPTGYSPTLFKFEWKPSAYGPGAKLSFSFVGISRAIATLQVSRGKRRSGIKGVLITPYF